MQIHDKQNVVTCFFPNVVVYQPLDGALIALRPSESCHSEVLLTLFPKRELVFEIDMKREKRKPKKGRATL